MGLLEVVIVGCALSMDVFTMSVYKGLSIKKLTNSKILLVGIYFGASHLIAPLLGYLIGTEFEALVGGIAHWIAFTLLVLIGIKMLADAAIPEKYNPAEGLNFKSMFPLTIATSIDAFAIGITFSLLTVNITSAILIIASITFCFAVIGVKLGHKFGVKKYKRWVEALAGLILIGMGIKTLLDYFYY